MSAPMVFLDTETTGLALTDDTHYSTVPTLGGWASRCTRCDRTVVVASLDDLDDWQDRHRCQKDAENRVTHKLAQNVLDRIVRDPIEVVLQRRADVRAEWARTASRNLGSVA